MQLIDIAVYSIELFAVLFVAVGLTTHLHYHWQHPEAIELKRFDRKLAEPVPALLLPSAPLELLQPFEMSLERMSAIEAIAAVHQPAVEMEPPTIVEEAIDYSSLSSAELRKACTDQGIKWRSMNGGKHLSKPQMTAALS